MAWVQKQSGLIKMEGSATNLGGASTFKSRECFMEANLDN